jgi:hypothetical protein
MLGSLISAGTSLLGGIFGSKSKKKAANMEYARQKDFARNAIQWKVNDAKAAGIHPLYALGTSTTQYAPQQVGGTDYGIAAAGQELGRSINAVTGVGGRDQAFKRATQQLSLQRMELENQLLSSRIATANQTMHPPAPQGETFVIPGQPGSGLVDERPMRKEKALKGGYQEPAPITDYGFTKTHDGYGIVQSHDAKDRLEEDFVGSFGWNMRNRVIPYLKGKLRPPYPAPPMHKWRFNPITMEYILQKPKFRRRYRSSRKPAYRTF